jgi:hypothetical protein
MDVMDDLDVATDVAAASMSRSSNDLERTCDLARSFGAAGAAVPVVDRCGRPSQHGRGNCAGLVGVDRWPVKGGLDDNPFAWTCVCVPPRPENAPPPTFDDRPCYLDLRDTPDGQRWACTNRNCRGRCRLVVGLAPKPKPGEVHQPVHRQLRVPTAARPADAVEFGQLATSAGRARTPPPDGDLNGAAVREPRGAR